MNDHIADVLGDFEQIQPGSKLLRTTGQEQITPGSNLPPAGRKKTRGRNKSTIALIEAMHKIVEETIAALVPGIRQAQRSTLRGMKLKRPTVLR